MNKKIKAQVEILTIVLVAAGIIVAVVYGGTMEEPKGKFVESAIISLQNTMCTDPANAYSFSGGVRTTCTCYLAFQPYATSFSTAYPVDVEYLGLVWEGAEGFCYGLQIIPEGAEPGIMPPGGGVTPPSGECPGYDCSPHDASRVSKKFTVSYNIHPNKDKNNIFGNLMAKVRILDENSPPNEIEILDDADVSIDIPSSCNAVGSLDCKVEVYVDNPDPSHMKDGYAWMFYLGQAAKIAKTDCDSSGACDGIDWADGDDVDIVGFEFPTSTLPVFPFGMQPGTFERAFDGVEIRDLCLEWPVTDGERLEPITIGPYSDPVCNCKNPGDGPYEGFQKEESGSAQCVEIVDTGYVRFEDYNDVETYVFSRGENMFCTARIDTFNDIEPVNPKIEILMVKEGDIDNPLTKSGEDGNPTCNFNEDCVIGYDTLGITDFSSGPVNIECYVKYSFDAWNSREYKSMPEMMFLNGPTAVHHVPLPSAQVFPCPDKTLAQPYPNPEIPELGEEYCVCVESVTVPDGTLDLDGTYGPDMKCHILPILPSTIFYDEDGNKRGKVPKGDVSVIVEGEKYKDSDDVIARGYFYGRYVSDDTVTPPVDCETTINIKRIRTDASGAEQTEDFEGTDNCCDANEICELTFLDAETEPFDKFEAYMAYKFKVWDGVNEIPITGYIEGDTLAMGIGDTSEAEVAPCPDGFETSIYTDAVGIGYNICICGDQNEGFTRPKIGDDDGVCVKSDIENMRYGDLYTEEIIGFMPAGGNYYTSEIQPKCIADIEIENGEIDSDTIVEVKGFLEAVEYGDDTVVQDYTQMCDISQAECTVSLSPQSKFLYTKCKFNEDILTWSGKADITIRKPIQFQQIQPEESIMIIPVGYIKGTIKGCRDVKGVRTCAELEDVEIKLISSQVNPHKVCNEFPCNEIAGVTDANGNFDIGPIYSQFDDTDKFLFRLMVNSGGMEYFWDGNQIMNDTIWETFNIPLNSYKDFGVLEIEMPPCKKLQEIGEGKDKMEDLIDEFNSCLNNNACKMFCQPSLNIKDEYKMNLGSLTTVVDSVLDAPIVLYQRLLLGVVDKVRLITFNKVPVVSALKSYINLFTPYLIWHGDFELIERNKSWWQIW
ncbi:MAG: hypothetical protein ISS36_00180 [Candidatus Aenigmarchaeota archaeon]|nr:hypothetical protein [Candidatus Aenigmarchaeota archaeon]